jgi:RNA polymerase sigma factor (sigma-70 family)
MGVRWASEAGGPGDEELLGRFLGGDAAGVGYAQDLSAEAAFQELVRRHGPMVLGVCRHILGEVHDAEDAFQATFLILARSANTIRDRRVLSRWLYEVAYRVALRARARASRRRAQEKEAAEMSASGQFADEGDPAWRELRPVLHEEVNRLPEKYRSAVVLCYLEGRTNEEAAELLRWPVGMVKGRLSRARELLRSRLTRRGLALSATFLMARLSQNTVFAEVVPTELVESTARCAVAGAHGRAAWAVSRGALELAEADLAEAAGPTGWVWRWVPGGMFRFVLVGALMATSLVVLARGVASVPTFGISTLLDRNPDAPTAPPARALSVRLSEPQPAMINGLGGGCHTDVR